MTVEQQFRQHLLGQCESTGFAPPELLLDYLVVLLSSRLHRVDIIPDPSFAERWMLLQQRPSTPALVDYGDTCLFFTAILPEYGHRRGLSIDYYSTLGISAYYSAADLAREDCYTQLGNWFYTLQKFLNSAITPDQRLALFNL
jgi:hypothetical protein